MSQVDIVPFHTITFWVMSGAVCGPSGVSFQGSYPIKGCSLEVIGYKARVSGFAAWWHQVDSSRTCNSKWMEDVFCGWAEGIIKAVLIAQPIS